MSAEIIPFDFEEQAVRVVMRDDDPWFVAADVCRVLEIANRHDAVGRLDEDERDAVGSTDSIGRNQQMTIINESGLYALVLTSRKAEAKRFRKWITAEVLPAIRRHGRYDHGMPAAPAETGEIAGLPMREAELWLQMVREARLTRGTRAAASIWDRSPLPPLVTQTGAGGDPAEGRAALAHLLAQRGAVIARCRDGEALDFLARDGLRLREDGLFIANFPLPVFAGTRWDEGRHRGALLAVPGVFALPTPLTLAMRVTRGIVVPWALIDGEGA